MVADKKHVCPIDKRQFATKAALAQHRAASHGGVSGGGPTPSGRTGRGRGRGRGRNGRNTVCRGDQQARTVTGTDIVQISTIATGKTELGTLLANFDITPSYFSNTRLAAEAFLWARWKPVKLVLRCHPSAGAMTSGAYTMGFTYDVDATIPSGASGIGVVAAMTPSATTNIYNPVVFNLPVDTSQKWYQVSSRERADTVHGKVFAILSAALGNITDTSKISAIFKLDWTVAFEGAVLPPGPTSGGTSLYVDSGYEGYHTTSTSDWADGTALSIKHAAGGALAPFSNGQTDTLYKLDEGAKLQYYKDASTLDNIKFGVLIYDFPGKHMAVFATKEQAQKYMKSRSSTDCLKYFAAGPTVTPDNPAWFPQVVSAEKSELADKVDKLCDLFTQFIALNSPSTSFVDLGEQ